MRDIVYIDIETIPAERPIRQDKQFIKEIDVLESIEARDRLFERYFKEQVKKRSLSSIDCQIISLSYAINDEPVKNIFDECEWVLMQKLVDSDLMDLIVPNYNSDPQVCAYNALNFDLPVIASKLFKYNLNEFVRAIPYGQPKDRHLKVFDPMMVFPKSNNEYWLKQSRMAEYLGIDDDSEIDASMVYDLYKESKFDEIIKYNNSDVELLRKICKRITI